MLRRTNILVALTLLMLAACGRKVSPPPAPTVPPLPLPGKFIPAEAQRAGDPEAGYRALVNNGYVNCGIPYSLYSRFTGPAPEWARLAGREGHNAQLPYNLTAFRAKSGVDVVSNNCLFCHAGMLNGQLIVGLGDAASDFTGDPSQYAELAGMFLTDPAERAEWRKWADRVKALAPYTRTSTMGVNPGDNVAAVLFSHRDPVTLNWSQEPLIELPPAYVVPADVPPWWRMRKKNAMFYTAAGRGDLARIMMTASTLCTDSVEDAREIDRYFGDIRAYIASLEPPAYPFPVAAEVSDRGRLVYEANCATCHGTHGPGGTYPNLVIPLDKVGTDPVLAEGAAQFAGRYVEWFHQSFYGETARLETERGYYAPPLDGIWATAPFLHNGSVPTLASLLDSSKRPQYWSRSFDSRDFDTEAVGWRFTVRPAGQSAEPNPEARKRIYDTTLLGYSNQGHTFGDKLSDDEREELLEYLKTL